MGVNCKDAEAAAVRRAAVGLLTAERRVEVVPLTLENSHSESPTVSHRSNLGL